MVETKIIILKEWKIFFKLIVTNIILFNLHYLIFESNRFIYVAQVELNNFL